MIRISATPRLCARLSTLAADRPVVIDYFASARCGAVVGDITAAFAKASAHGTYLEVAELEGVHVFADEKLVPLLNEAALVLDLKRLPFLPGLGVRLDQPERWLDFLDRPGIARRATYSLRR